MILFGEQGGHRPVEVFSGVQISHIVWQKLEASSAKPFKGSLKQFEFHEKIKHQWIQDSAMQESKM
jgi:hypothetical protein